MSNRDQLLGARKRYLRAVRKYASSDLIPGMRSTHLDPNQQPPQQSSQIVPTQQSSSTVPFGGQQSSSAISISQHNPIAPRSSRSSGASPRPETYTFGVRPEHQAQTETVFHNLFPAHSGSDVMQASGAPEGSVANFQGDDQGRLHVRIRHPDMVSHHTYEKGPDGKIVQRIVRETASRGHEGIAEYRDRFRGTIPHLKALGVSSIIAEPQIGPGGHFNHAAMGFNAQLKPHHLASLPPELWSRVPGKKLPRSGLSLHQLLSQAGTPKTLSGLQAWERHGTPIATTFDLSDSSPNFRAFNHFEDLQHQQEMSRSLAATHGTNWGTSHAPYVGDDPTIVPGVKDRLKGVAEGVRPTLAGSQGIRSTRGANPPGASQGSASSIRTSGVTKPNKPLSRKPSDLIQYAARKPVKSYPDIVAHAAALFDNPMDDTHHLTFADHLMDHYDDVPAAQAYREYANGTPEAYGLLSNSIRGHHLAGFESHKQNDGNPEYYLDAMYAAGMRGTRPQDDLMREATSMAQDDPDISWYQERRKLAGNHKTLSKRFDEPFWHERSILGRNPRVAVRPLGKFSVRTGKKFTTMQAAQKIFDKAGIPGLVHMAVALRHWNPQKIAQRDEERGVNGREGRDVGINEGNSKLKRSGKVKRYAKIDGHEQAHHLIHGFPIEHALRHLANDPKNTETVRALAKTAFTGKDAEGKELHGGPSTALWLLHDALMESEHPALKWYKWMNAADKIHVDHKVHQALSKVAMENELAMSPRDRATMTENRTYDPDTHGPWTKYLSIYAPSGVAWRVAENPRYNHAMLRRVHDHMQTISPEITRPMISESLKRHAGRAQYLWYTEAGHPDSVKNNQESALGDGKVPAKIDSRSPRRKGVDKASRYSKRRVVIETPSNYARGDVLLGKPPKNPEPDYAVEGRKILSDVENKIAAGNPNYEPKEKLIKDAVTNNPGEIPTLKTIKTLAKAGESTRGQYEHSRKVLDHLIGPNDTDMWVAANAILSPQTEWEEHSQAAMRLLRLWVDHGRTTDPDEVHKYISNQLPFEVNNNGKRLYSLYDYTTQQKILKLFTNPDLYRREKTHLGGEIQSGGRGKITDFRGSFYFPWHTALDTHQSKLTTPTYEEIKRWIDNKFSPGSGDDRKKIKENNKKRIQAHKDLRALRDSASQMGGDLPITHKIVMAITKDAPSDLASSLLLAQKNVISQPWKYNAYKVAMGQAAHEMGWEPREVQEAVWTAVVSIIAMKNYGVHPEKILDKLRHEDSFHAWNVGHILTRPGILHDLKAILGPGRSLASFIKKSQTTPTRSGKVSPGDAAAYQDAVSRIPQNPTGGAWDAVKTALTERGLKKNARKRDLVTRYAAIPRTDNFLDSLRHIQASNNLVPISQAIAEKLGAQTESIPALHNTPRGSVPGMVMAIYGQQDPSSVHYLASQISLANQPKNKGMAPPGYAVFHVRPDGPDKIYKFYQEGSGLDILQKMDRVGLTSRVISPHRKGFNVIVPDPGGTQYQQIQTYQRTHGVQLQVSQGHLKTVGSTDKAQAREIFRGGVVKGAAPQQMSRGVVTRYSKENPEEYQSTHKAFQRKIQQKPHDQTNRMVYADWIEEHDPDSVEPGITDMMRTHVGPMLFGSDENGRVRPVEKWTMHQIREHMNADYSNWFSPGNMRWGRTQIHGQPTHGPYGVAFITSEQIGQDPDNRFFHVRHFMPGRPATGESRIKTVGIDSGPDQQDHHETLEGARAAAKIFVNTRPTRKTTQRPGGA